MEDDFVDIGISEEVENEFEETQEETTKARLEKLKDSLGSGTIADLLGELPEGYEEKDLLQMSPDEVRALSDETLGKKVRPGMEGMVDQGKVLQEQLVKEAKIADKIIDRDYPHLKGKEVFARSFYNRVTAEQPGLDFESRVRAGCDRATIYSGLKDEQGKRGLTNYAQDHMDRQDRMKTTMSAQDANLAQGDTIGKSIPKPNKQQGFPGSSEIISNTGPADKFFKEDSAGLEAEQKRSAKFVKEETARRERIKGVKPE